MLWFCFCMSVVPFIHYSDSFSTRHTQAFIILIKAHVVCWKLIEKHLHKHLHDWYSWTTKKRFRSCKKSQPVLFWLGGCYSLSGFFVEETWSAWRIFSPIQQSSQQWPTAYRQGGAPPVISWFIIPINYRYNPLINPSYSTYKPT